MIRQRSGGLEVPCKAFWIVAFPLAVILLGFALITFFGGAHNPLARALVSNGDAEAAGRLKMLGTWLLLAGICALCLARFFGSLHRFRARSRRRLLWAYAGLSVLGCVPMLFGQADAPRVIGEGPICAAIAPEAATPPATNSPKDELGQYEGQADSGPDFVFLRRPPCFEGGMRLLWWLNFLQRIFLSLVTPAVVLATIGCVALPARAGENDCRRQVERLNLQLYLTAVLFVSGLLFLSALLHWPGFAFRGVGATSYAEHVDALILYWGITYTVFIASYYLPVAFFLTDRCKRVAARAKRLQSRSREGEPELVTPASGILDLVKTVAALFAPAIVGLLGSVIHL